MFTGIIEDLGIVRGIEKKQNYRLSIESLIFGDQKIGQSIAVNGVCLTILKLKNNLATFDITAETLKRSNLGSLDAGEKVNLERALKIGDRLSGHLVAGHIDCVGKIISRLTDPAAAGSVNLKAGISKEDMKFVVPKGSVALNGVSLTIAELGADNFSVCLIPHTIENTNLKFKEINDELNIEFDLLGKYVLGLDRGRLPSPITEDFLRRHGY